jgi:hypothetical protein
MSDITRLSLTTREPSGLPDVYADKNGSYVFYSEHMRRITELKAQLDEYEAAWQEGIRYEQFKALEER